MNALRQYGVLVWYVQYIQVVDSYSTYSTTYGALQYIMFPKMKLRSNSYFMCSQKPWKVDYDRTITYSTVQYSAVSTAPVGTRYRITVVQHIRTERYETENSYR